MKHIHAKNKGFTGGTQVVKNPPVNAGDASDTGSIPGTRRCPGGGNDDPLQYACLRNPVHRRAWWATIHGVTKSQTQLSENTQAKKTLSFN